MRAEEWLILGLVIDVPSHGYEISQRYEQRYGSTHPLSRSRVYALLDRLRRRGLIERAALRPTRPQHRLRRSYCATPSGVVHYEQHRASSAHPDGHEPVPLPRPRVRPSPRPVTDARAQLASLGPSPAEGLLGSRAQAGAYAGSDVERERGLACAVRDGHAAASRLAEPVRHCASARIALQRLVRSGEQAERQLSMSNMRVVVEVAQSFRARGLDVEELVQIGRIELARAVQSYDPGSRFRLSQHVRWRVRRALEREIAARGRLVRLPQKVREEIKSLALSARILERERGREPSARELAAERGLEEAEVERLRELAREPISLGVSLSGVLAGAVASQAARSDPSVEEQVLAGMVGPDLRRALLQLGPRARHVLVRRYGLDDRGPQTLTVLAGELRCTRQNVHQLELTAAKRLRRIMVQYGYGPW